jgi:hypothetical protein
MKTTTSIQLLRLITFLPLVIVLLAIFSGETRVSRPPADQLTTDVPAQPLVVQQHG